MGRASRRKRTPERELRIAERQLNRWIRDRKAAAAKLAQKTFEVQTRLIQGMMDEQDAAHPERLRPWRNNPETGAWEPVE